MSVESIVPGRAYPRRRGRRLAAPHASARPVFMEGLAAEDFTALLEFRTALRRFNHWSEQQAKAVGLTHMQHQLMLVIKGHTGPKPPTIGDAADYLLLRHHSTVELVNRAQAAGYVQRERDERDGRIVRLSLTEKGAECIARL